MTYHDELDSVLKVLQGRDPPPLPEQVGAALEEQLAPIRLRLMTQWMADSFGPGRFNWDTFFTKEDNRYLVKFKAEFVVDGASPDGTNKLRGATAVLLGSFTWSRGDGISDLRVTDEMLIDALGVTVRNNVSVYVEGATLTLTGSKFNLRVTGSKRPGDGI